MEKILYILGAGFSAPLGIPVMTNFLSKSKDMVATDPKKYKHFENIYKEIERQSKVKNYLDCDLFNIEEILSILKMEAFVSARSYSKKFETYISEVISFYTPSIPIYGVNPAESLPGNWGKFIFGNENLFQHYGAFVASILGIQITQIPQQRNQRIFEVSEQIDRKSKYAVLTLNYDVVIENYIHYLQKNYTAIRNINPVFRYDGAVSDYFENSLSLSIAKIHGTVDPPSIIPPTWNKTSRKNIKDVWKLANQLISSATQIRFLGYSFPPTDTHFKYLLSSGIINSQNLKSIDVLCLDRSDQVEKRYRSVVAFRDFRFKNAKIEEYLEKNSQQIPQSPPNSLQQGQRELKYQYLEKAHQEFFD